MIGLSILHCRLGFSLHFPWHKNQLVFWPLGFMEGGRLEGCWVHWLGFSGRPN
jgi:hypothetical protein